MEESTLNLAKTTKRPEMTFRNASLKRETNNESNSLLLVAERFGQLLVKKRAEIVVEDV